MDHPDVPAQGEPTALALACRLSDRYRSLSSPQVQYTAIAIAYNLSQALFAGPSAFIATAVSASGGLEIAPSFLVTAAALLSGAALLVFRPFQRDGADRQIYHQVAPGMTENPVFVEQAGQTSVHVDQAIRKPVAADHVCKSLHK